MRERIHDTYAYFGSSIAITAGSAFCVFRTPALMNLFARTGWVSMLATIALMMGSGIVAQSIPYEQGFGVKQLAWAAHCAIMVLYSVFLLLLLILINVELAIVGRTRSKYVQKFSWKLTEKVS